MDNMNFDHRIIMCNGLNEGSELQDIIRTLTSAARMLSSYEDHFCQIVLVIAEKLCSDYIKGEILTRYCDWDEYTESCSEDVFTHFTGGAKKLTKEQFEALKSNR